MSKQFSLSFLTDGGGGGVCVCVCVQRERDRQTDRQNDSMGDRIKQREWDAKLGLNSVLNVSCVV